MTSSQSNDFFLLHRIIRFISGNAASSFFTEVRVIGGEHVPATGPLIVAATHHNMMLDPAILSLGFPHKRILNYWSKATLFANPIARWVLLSSGNIPVDRKSKDRRVLFKGTFEALSKGQAVALFPEGTSYTEPRIMQVKDGAAWAALEYTKWVDEQRKLGKGDGLQDVLLVPAAIVYTNKSKYRSSVIMEFGRPISMDSYKAQFLSNVEGAPRAAVKQLTRTLESELVEATINAPNWDTLYVARMARDILWEGNKSIDLEEFVNISQTLVDLFSTPDATPNIISVKRHLLEYYSLLQSTNLTNSVLSSLPLPRLLDPNTSTPLPSRLYTLVIFVSDTVSSLARLPFFVFPLIVHLPVYIMGRFGARLVEDEEETQAQNKVVFGLLSMFMIYPAAFFFLWALFWYTPVGALLAALTCYLFAIYHNRMIDDNYEYAKRFIAAWRILIGVWAPKKWDLSMPALSQYTTPLIPKENPWIDKKKSDPSNTSSPASSSNPNIPSILPPLPEISLPKEREPVLSPRRRPPTRRIMRHVLRARLEAIKALGSFFDQLQRAGDREKLKVKASRHLARTYGGMNEYPGWSSSNSNGNNDAEIPEAEQECWRYATEVITFLKKRGAKFPSVGASAARTTEEEWALLSSDGEGSSTPLEERGEIEWVTPKTQK